MFVGRRDSCPVLLIAGQLGRWSRGRWSSLLDHAVTPQPGCRSGRFAIWRSSAIEVDRSRSRRHAGSRCRASRCGGACQRHDPGYRTDVLQTPTHRSRASSPGTSRLGGVIGDHRDAPASQDRAARRRRAPGRSGVVPRVLDRKGTRVPELTSHSNSRRRVRWSSARVGMPFNRAASSPTAEPTGSRLAARAEAKTLRMRRRWSRI